MRAAIREEDAQFFVLFSATDSAGNIVGSNSRPSNTTHTGSFIVFTITSVSNNIPNIRILFKTEKKQFFSNSGRTFNRVPATSAVRGFRDDLNRSGVRSVNQMLAKQAP